MSADVDQEIYDDAVSLAGVKPQIKEKPNVKNIAAMFGGGGPAVSSKPVTRNNNAGSNKPVAVVPPSKSDSETSKVPMRGPKPAVKPLPKMNGEVKKNILNNTAKGGATSPVTGGKIAVPGAFSSDSTSPDAKLTDIRSSLKPVGGINTGHKVPKDTPTSIVSKSSPPSVSPKSPVSKTSPSSSSSPAAKSTSLKTDLCILTSDDNCKYRLKVKPQVFGSPPTKPSKLTDVDLKTAIASLPPALPKRPIPRPAVSITSDEVYDDVDNTRPVSEIKEYTEAEEAEDVSGGQIDQEVYDDVGISPPSPNRNLPKKPSSSSVSVISEGETYDDCAIEGEAKIEGEMEELYEALDDIQANAAVLKDDKKEKKKKEQEKKEKKEKEKKEKDERERQQKMEKEKKKKEKELWTKLKITGNEFSISEGNVRENTKGGRFDLALKKGQSVSIIRMTDCPQYKWLAKTQDGKVGYVEISNIEVDTQGIRHVMTGTLQSIKNDVKREASGEFEEVYDDVAPVDIADQDIYQDTM